MQNFEILLIVFLFTHVCNAKQPLKRCPVNEEYVSCVKTCPPETCESIGRQYKCPILKNCKPGCICKKNFKRNINKVCIPIEQCAHTKCGKNEFWDACSLSALYVDDNCVKIPRSHSSYGWDGVCHPRCYCLPGYCRDELGCCVDNPCVSSSTESSSHSTSTIISTHITDPPTSSTTVPNVICEPNSSWQVECRICYCNEHGTHFDCYEIPCGMSETTPSTTVSPTMIETTPTTTESTSKSTITSSIKYTSGPGPRSTTTGKSCEPNSSWRIGCALCYCNAQGTDYVCYQIPCGTSSQPQPTSPTTENFETTFDFI